MQLYQIKNTGHAGRIDLFGLTIGPNETSKPILLDDTSVIGLAMLGMTVMAVPNSELVAIDTASEPEIAPEPALVQIAAPEPILEPTQEPDQEPTQEPESTSDENTSSFSYDNSLNLRG